ncbi:glycosyl transferase [Novosphingobium sp. Gsoil 351]|uniref:glycosyl transferase n=1 Tax=Novosphingobium sp. Gsoil 351 TaxID=2675225 RepID=UPI0012B46635|nr:glycosyl transferase [Novosphingobium sp. Gsoil 351]QGN55394.1 glycosyl transferase [Novosphingobium sp. Gsoil 351]
MQYADLAGDLPRDSAVEKQASAGRVAAQGARFAFSLIGGQHQFWHAAPVAAALSRMPNTRVECFVIDSEDQAALAEMLAALGSGPVEIVVMTLPRALERGLAALRRTRSSPLKALRLVWWARAMRSASVIVTVERTSTLLKQIPGRCPPLAHIPHGVGGARRAKGMDPRFAKFDRVLLAGEADRRSTLEHGLLPADAVAVVGHVKLDGLRRAGRLKRRPLLPGPKPTVLYNPHFDAQRGSWQWAGPQIVGQIRASGRFNLITAPHVRLFEGASAAERAAFRDQSDGTHALFDPGSERSIDMTYTLAGDIYLGEFSSQLYEFLVIPRPCVFIDIKGDGGAGDSKLPDMWRCGETVTRVEDVVPALDRAIARHGEFLAQQEALVRDGYGDQSVSASERAAQELIEMAGLAA